MTMITPSYLGETIEYSSLHACRSTLEDPTAAHAAPSRVGLSFCVSGEGMLHFRQHPHAARQPRTWTCAAQIAALPPKRANHPTYREARGRRACRAVHLRGWPWSPAFCGNWEAGCRQGGGRRCPAKADIGVIRNRVDHLPHSHVRWRMPAIASTRIIRAASGLTYPYSESRSAPRPPSARARIIS